MSLVEVLEERDQLSPVEQYQSRVIPDAEAGTPEATQSLAERQPRIGTPPMPGSFTAPEVQQIDQTGLNLIEFFEGLLLEATWDPFGHVWTIGYGETSGIHQGQVWTQAQAQSDLVTRLANDYEPAVRALGVPLNQHQFDALCSFVWNVGPGSMSSSWTIGRLLRERDYAGAADSMLGYDTAGGVVLAGLVNRRRAERALFLTPMPPPPDPNHYEWFPVAEKFEGKNWNERAIVEEYDHLRKHGVLNRRKLKPVRADLKKLADRVSAVAHDVPKGKKPSWDEFHRGWRYQQLLHRSQGERIAK